MTDKHESRSRDRTWSLILLSGGRSRRMGADKAGLSIGGETFLARILRSFPDAEQRIVSTGVEQRIVYTGAGVPGRSAENAGCGTEVHPGAAASGTENSPCNVANLPEAGTAFPASDAASHKIIIIPDRIPDFGPLGGLEASLRFCTSEYIFVTACDQPLMEQRFAERLLSWLPDSFDAAVPVSRDGRIHPLSALYRTEILRNAVDAQIAEGDHRVRKLLERMRTMYVPADAVPGGARSLRNVNTPEEYAELCAGGGAEGLGKETGNAAGAGIEENRQETENAAGTSKEEIRQKTGNAAGIGKEENRQETGNAAGGGIPAPPELSYYERTPSGIPVFAIAAYSGTGKTTFLEKLIPELKRQRPGLRIGVVKHDVHGFTVDQEGKDTRRLADAGADLTAILNDAHAAVMEHRPRSVYEILEGLSELDLIFLEGFKKEPFRKILLYRKEAGQPPAADPAECFLVIADSADCFQGIADSDVISRSDDARKFHADFRPEETERIAAAVLKGM